MTKRKFGDVLAALSKAMLAVSAQREVDAILQAAAEGARNLVGARYAAVGVPDGRGQRLERFLVSGVTSEQVRSIGRRPQGHGILGLVRRTGQSLRLDNIGADHRAVGFPPHHPPMKSFLGVSIRKGDEVLGELYLTEKAGAPAFTAEDQELAEALAQHAAQAIVNSRLTQHLVASEEQYRLLTEGAPEIVFALDRVGRFTYVNDRIRAVTGLDRLLFQGRLLRDMVSPDDRTVVDVHLRAMRSGAPRTAFAVSAPDASGAVRHFEISLVPGRGSEVDFQGIARDVTEQRTLTRQFSERTSEMLTTREERQQLREFVSLVMQAQEDERARIAGDLHDTTVQTLTAIGRRLHSLAVNGSRDPDALQEDLTELAEAAMAEAEEVRRLSRNLRPSVLDHLGLAAGLEHLATELRATGIEVGLDVEGEAGQLDAQQRTALFRIAQEALRNVRRHSGAHLVGVRLRVGESEVSLTIEDNGCGFQPDQQFGAHTSGTARLGLAGMRERAVMLGGRLSIDSAPGAGTQVRARLPLDR